jgi:hypothetical protein
MRCARGHRFQRPFPGCLRRVTCRRDRVRRCSARPWDHVAGVAFDGRGSTPRGPSPGKAGVPLPGRPIHCSLAPAALGPAAQHGLVSANLSGRVLLRSVAAHFVRQFDRAICDLHSYEAAPRREPPRAGTPRDFSYAGLGQLSQNVATPPVTSRARVITHWDRTLPRGHAPVRRRARVITHWDRTFPRGQL